MRKPIGLVGWAMALGLLSGQVAAQSVTGSYFAEIDASDRVNSAGVALTRPEQILAQDRANVHRFGRVQPGDTRDGVFLDQAARAALPLLLARGTLSPEAERAIMSGRNEIVQVTIYGQGQRPSHLSVELVAAPAAPLASGDQPPRAATGAGATQPGAVGAGPSFDCAKAATETERAICAHPNLAVLDLALSLAWSAEIARIGGKAALPRQRDWLARRDACGGNVECLEQSLKVRITELGGGAPLSEVADGTPSANAAAADARSQSVDMQGIAAATVASQRNLILIDGHPIWGRLNYLLPPVDGPDLETHEREMAQGLHRAARLAATDDLRAALAGLPSLDYLQRFYDASLAATQDDVARLGIGLSKMPAQYRTHCENRPTGQQYDCATQYLETEFDRRRFVSDAAAVIARDFQANAFDMPMAVTMFCPLGRIDNAYDFDTGRVQWTRMIQAGICQADTGPFSGFGKVAVDERFDLANGVPESTEMPAGQVETLAQRQQSDPLGVGMETQMTPLMLTFPARIGIARDGEAGNNSFGMAPLRVTLTREGPVSLRWSGAPQEVIQTFAPSDGNDPAEAVDLWNASVLVPLIGQASEFDADALGAALAAGAADTAGPRLVRIAAWHDADEAGRSYLHSANSMHLEKPAQIVAQLAGIGLEQVGWSQVQSRESGVPDAELVLVFPRPLTEIRSVALSDDTVNINRGRYYMLAEMTAAMRMPGARDNTLVAVLRPIGFEVHAPGVDNAMRVAARPPLAEAQAPPRTTVFVPSVYWYAAKGAQLSGTDLETHMTTVFGNANLMSGDTFARLDAVRQAVSLARQDLDRNGDAAPWIVGRIGLAPYDIARSGWPVRQIQMAIPARDKTEENISRRILPEIRTSGLVLPMPEDAARRLNENFRGSNHQLPFRARIDLAPATDKTGLRPQAFLREVMLLPPQGSPSMPVQVSASFTPGEELATVILPEQAPAAPAPAKPTSVTEAVKLAAAQAAQSAEGAEDGQWPQLPEIAVAEGVWDLLGLRTGMSVADAGAAIIARGGVLAGLERRYEEAPPALSRAIRYQRVYILNDGTEAITLAAPNPGGPVLVIMRRILIPQGDLPFADIRSSLLAKYGPPAIEGSPSGDLAPLVWFSGDPGAQSAVCAGQKMDNMRFSQWRPMPGIGDPGFNIRQAPSAWQNGIDDYPVVDIERAAGCGQLLQYAAEDAQRHGAAAFTLIMLDAPSVMAIDKALAAEPEAPQMKVEF